MVALTSENVEINLHRRANMRIDKIKSAAGYRIDEPFQNLQIFGILIVLQIINFK